ncbi:MAG: type II toxin-antitoxin system VapC family toxin [Pseudomonadota bacterium]
MIVDASAILAVLRAEPDAATYARALAEAPARPWLSAVSYLAVAIEVDTLGRNAAVQAFESFLEAARLEVRPVTPAHARLARLAHATYGAGNHPASLSFPECFAYALARETGLPLLYKSPGFAETAISPALELA